MEERVTRAGISLKPVMDQSIYVRKSIEALVQEGVLGAILCSLVILLFLGQLRMTAIADHDIADLGHGQLGVPLFLRARRST